MSRQTYWFPANRYGWGWGMSAALVAVCRLKGEPPRWRRGDRQ